MPTSSIFVADVRESPYIAEAYSPGNRTEQEVRGSTPSLSLFLVLGLHDSGRKNIYRWNIFITASCSVETCVLPEHRTTAWSMQNGAKIHIQVKLECYCHQLCYFVLKIHTCVSLIYNRSFKSVPRTTTHMCWVRRLSLFSFFFRSQESGILLQFFFCFSKLDIHGITGHWSHSPMII